MPTRPRCVKRRAIKCTKRKRSHHPPIPSASCQGRTRERAVLFLTHDPRSGNHITASAAPAVFSRLVPETNAPTPTNRPFSVASPQRFQRYQRHQELPQFRPLGPCLPPLFKIPLGKPLARLDHLHHIDKLLQRHRQCAHAGEDPRDCAIELVRPMRCR